MTEGAATTRLRNRTQASCPGRVATAWSHNSCQHAESGVRCREDVEKPGDSCAHLVEESRKDLLLQLWFL